ncbi:uncharacterized protein LOC112594368 [Melanaphis sacchari]|uniref:uncharacterized protein LOC112594368 n=1 Tax=Melanaphis sacchari TaxID=742174 RepID=UPI000DC1475D|nr:uncharacterized protein LOC112594368 [Melanaphis sacchari]
MSSSYSANDTVLQLSVGKLNSDQKKYPNYKSKILRWFRRLKNSSIKKKIVCFIIIVICCLFFYLKNDNPEQSYKANKDFKNSLDGNGYKQQNEKDRTIFADLSKNIKKNKM